MSDAVSRDAVMQLLQEWTYCCDVEDLVRALPAVQPDAREAALQDAISHVRQALIDDAHQHGSIVTTRSSAMFTAEIIATNALSRIRKGDQP